MAIIPCKIQITVFIIAFYLLYILYWNVRSVCKYKNKRTIIHNSFIYADLNLLFLTVDFYLFDQACSLKSCRTSNAEGQVASG